MGFKSSYLYCCAFLAFLLIACKKEINSAGVNSLGVDNSKVMTIDSFDIETGSIIDDKIITSNPAYLLLGSYNDKDLGVCTASFCSELSLTSYNLNLNSDTVKIESCYLTISVNENSFSGKISPQLFKVHTLKDSLYSKEYYSSTQINVNPIEVSSVNEKIDFVKETVSSDSSTSSYILKIPIKNEFALEILKESKNNDKVFATQSESRKRF